jgi:hypothetical protein
VNGNERLQAVQHDTAACYRFVKATAAACELSSGFPSYSDPTRKLLKYIKDLSEKSLDFLAGFQPADADDPAAFRNRRELLWLIRGTWTKLHKYVKPAVDADTQNVPTELVRVMTQRVRLIPDCELLDFAVIHTDQLNYFQFPSGELETDASALADSLKIDLEFPAHLGIIATPHSQSRHIFLNALLAHEIGHFIFSKLKCLDRIEGIILEGLRGAFQTPPDRIFLNDVALESSLRGQLPGVLQDWAEELFCDLFGVYMLGPSFALASIELFDLGNFWAADGGIDQIAGGEHFKFHSKHPARLFRLWQQTVLLENLGWWDTIEMNRSHHIRIMEKCRDLRPSSFSFEQVDEPLGSKIIDAFCRTLESVQNEVARVTEILRDAEGHAKEIGEFVELRDFIRSGLCHAIVPSTLYVGDEFKKPSPIVLLNAAHLFYLSGIEDLIKHSDKPDPSKIKQRDIWMERVENWTTKALEDIVLSNVGGA